MNKTVLVTGSGRNIGRDVALRFAREGFRVVLNARGAEQIEAVAEEIRGAGGTALAVAADVSDARQVADMVERAAAELGGIDILVNNAVVRVQKPMLEMSDDEWRLVIDVALGGAFNCSRAVLPHMVEQRWGRIINMAGMSGQRGAANRVGVVSAKSGLIGMTKALAMEFAAQGITVNAVSPGLIDTERGEWTAIGDPSLQSYDRGAEGIPVGRRGLMSEIAATCLFLCTDGAAFITGQTISVNGGSYM